MKKEIKKRLQKLRNTPGEILQKMLDINPKNKLIQREINRRRSTTGGKSYDEAVKKQSSDTTTVNKVNRAKSWYSK